MSIEKENILALANELCAGGTEPHWRSAVSRAYYAAYHGCNDWHAQRIPGINAGPPGGVHQQLVNRLRNPAPETKDPARELSKRLGVRLDGIKVMRHKADYELNLTFDLVISANACARAAELLDLIPADM